MVEIFGEAVTYKKSVLGKVKVFQGFFEKMRWYYGSSEWNFLFLRMHAVESDLNYEKYEANTNSTKIKILNPNLGSVRKKMSQRGFFF